MHSALCNAVLLTSSCMCALCWCLRVDVANVCSCNWFVWFACSVFGPMPLKCILGGSLGNSVSTTQTTSNYVRIYSHDAEQGPKQPTLVHTQSYAPPRPVTKYDVRTQLHSARRTQPKVHHRQRRESQKKTWSAHQSRLANLFASRFLRRSLLQQRSSPKRLGQSGEQMFSGDFSQSAKHS